MPNVPLDMPTFALLLCFFLIPMLPTRGLDLPIIADPETYFKEHPVTLNQLIGTWKFVSVNGEKVPPFYIRFYVNSTAASWPAPANWKNVKNGVSRGTFRLKEGYLFLETGSGKDDPNMLTTLKGKYLIGITEDGNTLYYEKVQDRNPGVIL